MKAVPGSHTNFCGIQNDVINFSRALIVSDAEVDLTA